MAVTNSMFLFEVVVENVRSFVESRHLIIKSDFGDVFSLELKDPKQMHIVIPEPPPLPPEPPGKKGKKAKPKKPKGKKGKKGVVEAPPPEPAIQSGQSVLFTSNAEFLTQTMKKSAMEVSLWSKEDHLVFIGSCTIPWDPVFLTYLQKIYSCEQPPPPTVKDDYNIFEEGTPKIMAKLSIQVKLTYLSDRVVSCFRTLSEDPNVRKCLYTGMNSKTTSYICTLKTTDEEFEANRAKVESQYTKDRPAILEKKPLVFADYKNIPGAKVSLPGEDKTCCLGHADKPPDSKYKSPETCPDIDFICDYVRKVITSCNDNMRMLTPRPTIRPRVKATDIDRLCYCRETSWPQGKLAERFRKETQGGPCPICVRDPGRKPKAGVDGTKLFDIANIRGPCGRPDCRIARDMRLYLENLFDEDNKEFNIADIVGPCGSKSCTLVDKIKDFLRHKGAFAHGGATLEGLPTQCACVQQMQNALKRKGSCDSICSHECENSESEDNCGGKVCPYKSSSKDSKSVTDHNTSGGSSKVYNVYYFTVEYDQQPTPSSKDTSGNVTPVSSKNDTPVSSKSRTETRSRSTSKESASSKSHKFKFCSTDCPQREESVTCSKGICAPPGSALTKHSQKDIKCVNPECPTKEKEGVPVSMPSPMDSDIIISFKDIHNPCCVKSCSVAEKVKDFIAEGLAKKAQQKSCMDEHADDPCYCDCDCTFKFTSKTTYCPVCGGYECLGDDMATQPEFKQPHPCPIYHNLYDKEYIKTESPWAEPKKPEATALTTNLKTKSPSTKGLSSSRSAKTLSDKKSDKKEETPTAAIKKQKKKKKAVDDFEQPRQIKKSEYHTKCFNVHMGNVPKNMGWLWTAEDVPGMKPRPKAWRPGAANRILVRRYRTIREGVDIIAKKKRALLQKKKKIEMKPTLIVKKLDGEYTVQMEVFKKYSKERMLHQYPYDEKPPLIYTIGKTEETKTKIQKQRERRERRETRRKCRLLQSTFRDKCQEICLKAYNQAIGLLPLNNPNNPDCPCDIEAIKVPSPVVDSCSCSQSESVSSSDTDGDDWVIEFTPPLAKWDAKAKHPPVLLDNECQYNYLDFKVKLLDKQGNPVPRYFKGPDGNQECSDLGGFWGPGHIWLEINKDGYIGPDNRWVPINFTGPDGLFYLSEDGQFTDHTGHTWRIGIDGYVDKDGKWAWYPKRKVDGKGAKSISTVTGTPDTKKPGKAAKNEHPPQAKPEHHDTTNKSKHKAEKKVAPSPPHPNPVGKEKPKKVLIEGEKHKNHLVMNMDVTNFEKRQFIKSRECNVCNRHILVECDKLNRYNEIMKDLKPYGDLGEIRPPIKTNRASNTPFKAEIPLCTGDNKLLQSMVAARSISMERSLGSVFKSKVTA